MSSPPGITRPWECRRSRRSAAIPDGSIPAGHTPTSMARPRGHVRCRAMAKRAGGLLGSGPLQTGAVVIDPAAQVDAGLHRGGQQLGALQLIKPVPEGMEQIQ